MMHLSAFLPAGPGLKLIATAAVQRAGFKTAAQTADESRAQES
jgi:hypothetical protein